jgi:hypothetical protein
MKASTSLLNIFMYVSSAAAILHKQWMEHFIKRTQSYLRKKPSMSEGDCGFAFSDEANSSKYCSVTTCRAI